MSCNFTLFACKGGIKNLKVPTRVGSRRQRCDSVWDRGFGGSGAEPQLQTFLWKIFDRMELAFIGCLLCQKDCARFWTSWWCCNFILGFILIFHFLWRLYIYRYLFSFIGLKYNSLIKKLGVPSFGISWDLNFWIPTMLCCAIKLIWFGF